MSVIFPAGSPVDRLGGEKPETPPTIHRGLFKRIAEHQRCRIAPLLQAKDEVDRVYSNGYFENHYPDADKKLKDILHRKVMAAWSNALNELQEEEDHDDRPTGGSGLTIIINPGK